MKHNVLLTGLLALSFLSGAARHEKPSRRGVKRARACSMSPGRMVINSIKSRARWNAAVQKGSVPDVLQLISQGVSADTTVTYNTVYTLFGPEQVCKHRAHPLKLAACSLNARLVEVLLAAGVHEEGIKEHALCAMVDHVSLKTPAQKKEAKDILRLLREHGVDLNYPGCDEGYPPVVWTVTEGNVKGWLPLLLAAGAAPDAQTAIDGADQQTGLMCAVGDYRLDLVKQLVAAGANVGLRDSDGKLPLDSTHGEWLDADQNVVAHYDADGTPRDDEGNVVPDVCGLYAWLAKAEQDAGVELSDVEKASYRRSSIYGVGAA